MPETASAQRAIPVVRRTSFDNVKSGGHRAPLTLYIQLLRLVNRRHDVTGRVRRNPVPEWPAPVSIAQHMRRRLSLRRPSVVSPFREWNRQYNDWFRVTSPSFLKAEVSVRVSVERPSFTQNQNGDLKFVRISRSTL